MDREAQAQAENLAGQVNPLIEAVRRMAIDCRLQNAEQVLTEQGAIGAVYLIRAEYSDLLSRYLKLLQVAQQLDRGIPPRG